MLCVLFFWIWTKLSIKDVDFGGKRVLLRVDYNVPMEEENGRMIINDAHANRVHPAHAGPLDRARRQDTLGRAFGKAERAASGGFVSSPGGWETG